MPYNNAQNIEDSRIKALSRSLLRLVKGVAVFLLVAFAALVLWLRYDALPNVDRYRADIVSSIEKSSGMAVKVRALTGGWGGLRPQVALEGLEISDRAGRAAFQLQRAEVTVSWWSLLYGRLRFHDVDFYRPALVLRRGADGLIYLADKPLNAAGPGDDGAFTEWLLDQPRVAIHDATLTWRDDFGGAPELRLSQVQIAIEKSHGHHHAALSAAPPAELAGHIDVRADVRLRREGPRWRGRGEAYAEMLNTDLARLKQHLPVPETLRSGAGSLRFWVKFSPDHVDEIVADLAMRNARAQLAADVLPLDLASISGRAIYRVKSDGFSFATEGLRFRLASGAESQQPGNFMFTRTEAPGKVARLEVKADGIDLKIAATLLDYFPVPRDAKSQVLRFAPRGRIKEAVVSWTDDGARAYSVKGNFEDLGVNAVEPYPGVTGVSGSIEGSEAGGTLKVAGRNAIFDLRQLFKGPLALDTLEADTQWRHAGDALEVQVAQARVVNADADLTFSGLWRAIPDAKVKTPGYVDFRGTFARAAPSRTFAYLPNRIALTRDWLEAAVQGGEVPRATFELKGDLYEFPFGAESKGHFLVEGDVRNARLRYHPNWPSVDAIDGTFRFENRRMEIRAKSAAIFASRVRSASAVIEDLSEKPPLLVIDGDIDTTGGDSVRFLRESPLVNGPGAFTRAVSIEGPARFRLGLRYPLGGGSDPVRVNGEYTFNGAIASVARTLQLRDIKGKLTFTEKGVSAPALAGTMFGKPATLALSNEADGRVLTAIEGGIDAANLAAYVPAPIARRLAGEAAWKGRVVSGAQGTEITVTSDLKDIASSLPEPGAKAAGTPRPVTIRIERPGAENEVATAALDGGIHWRSTRLAPGGAERWQVALKMGSPVTNEVPKDGLWLYGEVPSLDVDAWLEVFAQPRTEAPPAAATAAPEAAPAGGPGIELRGIDLDMGQVRYLGRDFAKVSVELERKDAEWNGNVESPLIAGAVQWSPQGRGRVIARLSRLSIPEARPGAAPAQAAADTDLPSLDVVADRFDFRGRTLGRLDLKAQQAGEEWRIDKLDINAPHSKFHSSGGWRRTGAGSLTTLGVKLESENLSALLGVFGYGDYLKRGTGQLEGTLAWPGQPHEFSMAILSGSFKVGASRGQFAKLEPGAGKLLGLLSLQSLPRRAMFDFSDVFSGGFAFEKIEGDIKIARGILLTDNFEISGGSAFVSLAGEVSLPQETQTLNMKVVPEIGESAAIAATVLGTPVLGLSTLLLSKVLNNPLGKAVAYEYSVTGSWDNPVVTRLSAPPAAAPASPPPAPAKAASNAEAQK